MNCPPAAPAAVSEARDISGGGPGPRQRVPAGPAGHAHAQAGGVSASLRTGRLDLICCAQKFSPLNRPLTPGHGHLPLIAAGYIFYLYLAVQIIIESIPWLLLSAAHHASSLSHYCKLVLVVQCRKLHISCTRCSNRFLVGQNGGWWVGGAPAPAGGPGSAEAADDGATGGGSVARDSGSASPAVAVVFVFRTWRSTSVLSSRHVHVCCTACSATMSCFADQLQ